MARLGWLGAVLLLMGLGALVAGLLSSPSEIGTTFTENSRDAVSAGVTLTRGVPGRAWFEVGTALVALGGLALAAWSVARTRRGPR